MIEAPVSAASSSSTPPRIRSISLRSVVISLLLAALWGYVVPIVDYSHMNTFLGAAHLPAGAIATLLVLLLIINPVLKWAAPKLAFAKHEILTIYATTLFSTLVGGRGAENIFIPNILGSFYLATRENKWLEFMQPYTKPWLTPALNADGSLNLAVAEAWYLGGGSIPWAAWLVPLGVWSAIIFSLYFMLACMGVILRAQWAGREALAFPLLKLPLAMTADADEKKPFGTFFRQPLMWIGFGIAVFIQGLNGLSFYYPEVPYMPLDIPTGQYFTEAPWNQIGGIQIRIWLIAVGITYLLSSEISFSLWFFFLFHKLQLMGAYYLGWMPNTIPDPVWTRGFSKGFIAFQQYGAILAYGLSVLWIGREHFKFVARRAFGRARRGAGENEEALSYPVAFWGFLASSLFLLGISVAAGIRLDLAIMIWLTYLLIAVVLTRLVVEAGLILVHTGWMPLGPISGLVGKYISIDNAVPASLFGMALMTDLRGFLLPSFLHSFKLAHDERINAKQMLALIGACVVLAFGVGVWTILRLGYEGSGALTMQEWWAKGNGGLAPARNSITFLRGLEDSWGLNWGWTGVGFGLTLLLMTARSRLPWFPLHPLGYVIMTPFAIQTLSFSIFVGWLAKTLILKYGGTPAYRAALPGFLGLVLGDVFMMITWAGVDAWQGRTGHYLMPN